MKALKRGENVRLTLIVFFAFRSWKAGPVNLRNSASTKLVFQRTTNLMQSYETRTSERKKCWGTAKSLVLYLPSRSAYNSVIARNEVREEAREKRKKTKIVRQRACSRSFSQKSSRPSPRVSDSLSRERWQKIVALLNISLQNRTAKLRGFCHSCARHIAAESFSVSYSFY